MQLTIRALVRPHSSLAVAFFAAATLWACDAPPSAAVALGVPTASSLVHDETYEGAILPGGPGTALAINKDGLVLGFLVGRGYVVWHEDGRIVELPLTDPSVASAVDLNDRGDVLITVWTPPAHTEIWNLNSGSYKVSPNSPSTFGTIAAALNNHGHVAGSYQIPPPPISPGIFHPFIWARGEAIDLGLARSYQGFATDVNDHGEVVGWANVPRLRAFVWSAKGGFRTLPTGVNHDVVLSRASSINNRGDIVGPMIGMGTVQGGALWTRDGEIIALGMSASDINNDRMVAGARGSVASIWTPREGIRDLPAISGMVSAAGRRLNERGVIVGVATGEDGRDYPIRWVPKRLK